MLKLLSRILLTIQVFLVSLSLFTTTVLAHEGEADEMIEEIPKQTLEDTLRTNSIKIVIVSSIIILGFVALTVLLKDRYEWVKKFIFL